VERGFDWLSRAEILRTSFIAKYGRKALWRLKRPHRRCWPSRPDPCWRWPSRLVATAAENRLSLRRAQPAHVVCGSQRLPNSRDL